MQKQISLKSLLLFIVFSVFPEIVFATPEISNVAGNFLNNEEVNVNGLGFGN